MDSADRSETNRYFSRRDTLTVGIGGLATALSGCLGFGDPDLIIENDLDQSVTADIDITRLSDMRVVVQTDRSIGASETTEFTNPMDESSEYRIQVTTREANSGGEKTLQIDDADSVKIRATIASDGVTFTEES
jgi:hypothetical protein